MEEKPNTGSNDSTQHIKSNNMNRTNDNQLRHSKKEDPMSDNRSALPSEEEKLSDALDADDDSGA